MLTFWNNYFSEYLWEAASTTYFLWISAKKTNRQYYEYYQWTDRYYEWTDEYYEWTDEYYEWKNEYYELKNEYFEWEKSTTSGQASNTIT